MTKPSSYKIDKWSSALPKLFFHGGDPGEKLVVEQTAKMNGLIV
jgi:hypothetical protein